MAIRRSLKALSLTLTTLMLAACGTSPLPGALAEQQSNLAAMAANVIDFPAIERQIEKELIQPTTVGWLERALPNPGTVKPITFLTYKALNNNLSGTLTRNLNILERAGSSMNVNALAFADTGKKASTCCYYIRQDSDARSVTSPFVPVTTNLGPADSGSPLTLGAAINWAVENYPSRMHWLDINDHGGGYYGICQDDATNSVIRLPDLASAIATGTGGQKLDVLSFDACLMATTEVAYELRDQVRYIVGSEDETMPFGMNYDKSLVSLSAQALINPAELGHELVDHAQEQEPDAINTTPAKATHPGAIYTIAELDLAQAANLAHAVDQLAGALLPLVPTQRQPLLQALQAVPPFYVSSHGNGYDFSQRDLNTVVVAIKGAVSDPGVQAACDAVSQCLYGKGGLILYQRSLKVEGANARGVSIYMPTNGKLDPIYLNTAFAKDTRWPQFLTALGG